MSPSPPSSNLPSPNPIPSFWTATPDPLDNYRSTPSLPDQTDILIIGAGYSGICTAYHLFTHPDFHRPGSAPPSVTVLDARALCSGATGRNGGHIKPDAYSGLTRYASMYGWGQAAAIQKFETDQVFLVKEMCEREELLEEAEFVLTRGVDVLLDEEMARTKVEEYEAMKNGGRVDLRDVQCFEGREAARVSGVHNTHAAFTFTAAHIYPRKLVLGLLRKLLPLGLKCYSHTPVVSITSSPSSSSSSSSSSDQYKHTITASDGSTIRARKVILATNAYTSALLPQYKDKIVPVRGVCSHLKSKEKGALTPHLPCTYSLKFDKIKYDYLIPRLDGSIIVGGARSIFWHKKSSWWHNSNDGELVEGSEEYFDGYMQKYFSGWEESGAEVGKVWTGIMGYSSDLVPHIGMVPSFALSSSVPPLASSSTSSEKSDIYLLAGFSGHGMPQIYSASKAIARMVIENIKFEETGLPACFQTTAERLKDKRNWCEEGLRGAWAEEGGLKQAEKANGNLAV